MREQEGEPANAIRNELLERLRALETPQSAQGLAELAYQRAREALERALEEARNIRLQAIEDARSTREHELTSLMESLRSLRQSAESQIESLLRRAENESIRMQERAQSEAETALQNARVEADQVRAEATAVWAAAEERRKTIEKLESELDTVLAQMGKRLGLDDQAQQSWRQRMGNNRQ